MARLSDEEIEERLSDAKGWERDGEAIHRQFELGISRGQSTSSTD